MDGWEGKKEGILRGSFILCGGVHWVDAFALLMHIVLAGVGAPLCALFGLISGLLSGKEDHEDCALAWWK